MPDDSPEPDRRRSGRSLTITPLESVRRKTDGKIFSCGDFVLLESPQDVPLVGFIRDFVPGYNGIMEVRTVWFMP